MNTSRNDDLIENPSPRCPVALVLDTSGSMSGEPIEQVNQGANFFVEELKKDELARWSVELAVFTAGGHVQQLCDFEVVSSVHGIAPMSASGSTPLGEATRQALQALEQRKKSYRATGVPYYQPWLVIISDGGPTDTWEDVARQTYELTAQRKLVCLPVGVQGAALDVLGRFSNKGALPLDGLKFAEFFQWLSASLQRVSASSSTASSVQLPPVSSWAAI